MAPPVSVDLNTLVLWLQPRLQRVAALSDLYGKMIAYGLSEGSLSGARTLQAALCRKLSLIATIRSTATEASAEPENTQTLASRCGSSGEKFVRVGQLTQRNLLRDWNES